MKLSSTFEHLLLVLALATGAGLFVHFNVLWRWDNLIYDAQLSLWTRAVADDVIIVEIDDQSLQDLGHWPWPRSVHARLIERLSEEAPRAIGLDIIFSEPDQQDPRSDKRLSEAIANSGRVVLPVYMSRPSRNAVPIEALPLPIFTRHAAALGHVYVDISNDGVARRIYLQEGIGKPYWPHFGLALLRLTDPVTFPPQATERPASDYSSMQWSRERPLLIPYAGPPGHFPSIGYSQVLAGEYPRDLFRNRIVLIGATAEGMGDALATPLSGGHGAMPGVEIIANVIDALRNDLRIVELPEWPLIVLTMLLVTLPILFYPYLNPTHTLALLFGSLLLTITLVAVLLWWLGLWVPASTMLLFQLLSYPLWSWRRLVLAMRHLNLELDRLLERQNELRLRHDRNLGNEIEFLASLIPLSGWVVFDAKGQRLLHRGSAPPKPALTIPAGDWSIGDGRCWARIDWQQQDCLIGLALAPGAKIDERDQRLLDNLIHSNRTTAPPAASYLQDVFQARMAQVQAVGDEYEALHQIIDDSLSGMADGVLICDSHGQVILSNRRAGWYLQGDDNAAINGKPIWAILKEVQLSNQGDWHALLQQVMLERERAISEAQHESGRDLLVELSPLQIPAENLSGCILNFSDISILKASERKRNEVLNFLSHDLRSPLSSMIAMIELARNKGQLEEMRAMLDEMQKHTYKTLHLAEQFLQLSRANAREQLEFHEVDFNSVVLNAIDQLWALSSKLQVNVEHEFSEEELWTHGEPDLLERAITNLLSNALKHSSAGGQVTISIKLLDGDIKCCVDDQGPGIPPEDQPYLFEMFRRTRVQGVERKQGIGLGLAFVDAVARRHGGHVEVNSRPGHGATFCLWLPQRETGGQPH